MSAKRDPDEDDDDDEPESYLEEDEEEEEEEDDDDDDDEDDEDDEDDFHPGDDEEEEEEHVEPSTFLEGILSIDPEQKLHFKGDRFHLQSTAAVPWNLLDQSIKPKENSIVFDMTGPCDVALLNQNEANGDADAESSKKPTPRNLKVTVTVADSSDQTNGTSKRLKSSGDDDDEKRPASILYHLHAIEVIGEGTPSLEFQCSFHPLQTTELSVQWQVRIAQPTSAAAAAVAAPVAAAAARSTLAGYGYDDDDEDVEEDEAIDHNELIALHEDAGLSVDALRKRYRGEPDNAGDLKKAKGDDEDDDDIEF
jgi:hypothetical protein